MEEIVKILLVDDDEVDRMAVRRALKAAGIAVESSEASSCAAAIATLQQQPFDCVFLDYRLPDGDGLSLVQQVRSLGLAVPLIVLTGQGDEQIAVALMKAGASDYLSKAKISPENLSRSLRNAVRIHQAEQAAALAGQKLKESEERYRLVLEGANDGIWDWYCATDQVYCNDRLLEIIGVSRTGFSLTPAAFTALMHPEDLPRIRAVVAAHLSRNEKCEVEFRIRHASGAYRYCIARGKASHARYSPLRISGVLTDITERTQLEEALRASESRFRRLADANVIGIVVADQQGNITETNNAFLEMLDYTRQDLSSGGLRWQNVTPSEYAARDQQAAQELVATGVLTPFEKEYIRKDGSRVSALVGGALVEAQEKTAICFVIDLSQRKHAEAEIVKLNRDLERRVSELQTLLDVIPIGIAIAEDSECRCVRLNPALTKLLELPLDVHTLNSMASGQDLLCRDQEVATEQLLMHRVAAEGATVLDAELDLVIQEGGPVVKLLGNAVPLFDEQGKSRGGVGAFLDITERKRVEEQERFLAEASALLTISLDYKTILENLAGLVVPRLADWCTVHIVEEDRSIPLVAVAHVDPVMVQGAKDVQRRYPVNLEGPFGTPKVVRTGKAEFYPQVPDSLLEAAAHDAEHLQILRQVGFKSFICVPLLARGRTLGAISFVLTTNRSYTQADLALAEDLGRRAGLAVDNSRLYREATDIGENLRQAIIILGEQQQQLRALQRITNLLNQRLTNLPGLLKVMVLAVCDGIGDAEFALILLHNPTNNRLELTATAGSGAEKLPPEFSRNEEGLLGQVFSTGESQLQVRSEQLETPNAKRQTPNPELQTPNSELRTPNSKLQPASLYAVAIESAQAGRLGVLVIGNWENPAAFDIEDRNLLVAVGEQAAIAINNARLLNALEEREERLGVQNEVLAQQNRELEHRQQQIEQQNLELIEAARLKSQFLATMSHELRTPMNAVIGFAQVLLRQRSAPLSHQQVDMVERILNNGKNLLALIDDILDLSKIEAGRLELKLEEFSLTQLILTTIAELRPLAEQKQLPLKVYKENLQNPRVINDSTRLRQILVNLLSNAIKFTDTGSVEVRVSESSDSQVVFSVKDTGIGIAEADIERIFEEFRQVDQTLSKKYQGTGLGLAITKSLVTMMKGTITVESKLGQGSTFQVELPRRVRSEE